MDRHLDRRTALRLAGLGIASTVAAPAVTGCGAALFNPATTAWFSTLTSSLSATLLANRFEDALKGNWAPWEKGRNDAVDAQRGDGYTHHSRQTYGDAIPPAIFISMHRGSVVNPMTDRLTVCVEGGTKHVVFDAWAWQTLAMFIDDLTKDKEGDDLARYRALCSTSLTPAGVTPVGSSTNYSRLLRYQARNGGVEFNLSTRSNGQTRVQIIVEGIPKSNGGPTIKEFTLPEKAAEI